MSSPPPCASPVDKDIERFEYWAGNPDVEIAHGHIYVTSGPTARSVPFDLVDVLEDMAGAQPSFKASFSPNAPASASSCVVLAGAVPCCMPVPEFLEFVGAFGDETHRHFRHCRVLYGRSPEEYLVAMWLVSPEAAAQLVERFDGRPYNSIEPGVCRMHRVVGCSPKEGQLIGGKPTTSSSSKAAPVGNAALSPAFGPSVTAASILRAPVPKHGVPPAGPLGRVGPGLSPSRGPCRSPASSPSNAPPFLLEGCHLADAEEGLFLTLGDQAPRQRGHGGSGAEGAFCTICRDYVEEEPSSYQLTELGGAAPLTILCGHTFHARCLSHWCDSNCPLCRFQQQPNQASSCDVCGQSEGIYICLVCSFIGCMDQQGKGHAQQHYQDTNHAYALEVSTQKVWDYAGNGYVHRLLFNSEDGKMVEHSGPPPSPGGGGDGGLGFDMEGGWGLGERGGFRWADVSEYCDDELGDCGGSLLSGPAGMARRAKKQESVVAEFNALLASQLTAQQQYFEERQREQERQHKKELSEWEEMLDASTSSTAEAQQCLDVVLEKNRAIEQSTTDAAAEEEVMRKQRKMLEALSQKISGEQKAFEKQADSSREQQQARKKSRNLEVEDLQQQIRDLELYVQMRKKLEVSVGADDLQGAHLVVTESDQPGRGRGGRRGRRK